MELCENKIIITTFLKLGNKKLTSVTYANMRGVRAVDRIVDLCQRDLAFIWLTKGQKPQRVMLYAIGRNIMKYHRFLHHEIWKYEGKKEQKAA